MVKRDKLIQTVESTLAFIKVAHEGQTDKSGVPYWKHPAGVLELLDQSVPEFGGIYTHMRLAALLHDVVEDTPYTLKDLLRIGFDKQTVEIVRIVSRTPEDGTFFHWIESIAKCGNSQAIRIKILDTRHNSLPERIESLPKNQRGIIKRYAKALSILEPVYWDVALIPPKHIQDKVREYLKEKKRDKKKKGKK